MLGTFIILLATRPSLKVQHGNGLKCSVSFQFPFTFKSILCSCGSIQDKTERIRYTLNFLHALFVLSDPDIQALLLREAEWFQLPEMCALLKVLLSSVKSLKQHIDRSCDPILIFGWRR